MGSVITLTTDFGTEDAYVAAMKGIILGINPGAAIVDVCHNIEPQNIAQAAFVISTVYEYFPRDTIHTVIIDPEVGSQRRAIILKTPSALFVAPDNGVLSHFIGYSEKATPSRAEPKELPVGFKAVTLTNPKFWHHPVSSTFHGRDIFAPVAAHLSLGTPIEEFGDSTDSLFAFKASRPIIRSKGDLIGHIIHIDRFGNLISDIKEKDLPRGKFSLEVADQAIKGLSSTYAEGDQLISVIGSSGYLEVALKNGSAAALLNARIGAELKIEKAD